MIALAERRAPARPNAVHGPGRPDRYIGADGNPVPSVTTITSRFKDSGALLAWAHRQGTAGIPLNEARDKAADAGHVTHAWIADFVADRPLTTFPFTPDEIIDKAENAFAAFIAWAERVRLEIVATEMPLVHSRLGYGGTFDGLGFLDLALGGRALCLLDWKSGNRTYPEHLIQLAAYRELLRDAAGARSFALDLGTGAHSPGDCQCDACSGRAQSSLPLPTGGVIVRLDKETGEPHPREFDEHALDLGWAYFSGARDLYELDKDLAKMVAEPKKGRAA